jgi:hypothetical protein
MYPPEEGGKLMGLEDGDYDHVKSMVEELQKSQSEDAHHGNRPISVVRKLYLFFFTKHNSFYKLS